MKIPIVYVVELAHRPGSLASLLGAVAELGLTVEGLGALARTQDRTRWELTLELDPGQEGELLERIDRLENARVLGHSDRVFDRHRDGKIRTVSRTPIESLEVLRDLYTPGVARVCLAIRDDPGLAREYTGVANSVAIVTNGSAVLGLGDIGPVAGLPVMEGKAALFERFAGLSATPILINRREPRIVIETVEAIAQSFGAIQLEDIAAPECFEIEAELTRRLSIPVLHDDQHGTAVVVLAALRSAERLAGFQLDACVVGQIGLGAAGLAISRLLLRHGVQGLLGADLSDDALERLAGAGGTPATIDRIMREADVVIATTGVPGLIKSEQVRKGQIIFALSNPDPEIEPRRALDAGAAFAVDGGNLNNVLAFPGLFRGALDARAEAFTDEMLLAAADAIARSAEGRELIPSPLCRSAHHAVANAVRDAATAGGSPIKW